MLNIWNCFDLVCVFYQLLLQFVWTKKSTAHQIQHLRIFFANCNCIICNESTICVIHRREINIWSVEMLLLNAFQSGNQFVWLKSQSLKKVFGKFLGFNVEFLPLDQIGSLGFMLSPQMSYLNFNLRILIRQHDRSLVWQQRN